MPTVYTSNDLSPAHAQMLSESGIAPHVARERGYATIEDAEDVRLAPWAPAQRLVPVLHVPAWDVHGKPLPGQIRPDAPREVSRGSKAVPLKYETPKGSGSFLDVNPLVRERLLNTDETIVITEGCKKADAAISAGLLCIALPGVWNWRGKSGDSDSTAALPAFDAIPLASRKVIIAFDSDVTQKDAVRQALRRFAGYLKTYRADVYVAILSTENSKVGLDDWLVDGGDADMLDAIARPAEDVIAELDEQTVSRRTHGRDDKGNAARLYDAFGSEVAWCPSTGWYAWDGFVWRPSSDHVVLRRAQVLQDLIYDECVELQRIGVTDEELGKHRAHAKRAGLISKVKDAVEWLRPNVMREWSDYDRDPYLLAVGNGTLELHPDGAVALRDSDLDDMLTLRTSTVYTEDARAPFFERTVEMILPDPDVRGYVQRLAGASMIGANASQTVSIFFGSGANGKSTFLYALSAALGENLYVEIDPKSLQDNKRTGSAPTPDLMRLLGARLVTAVEASERLDTEMLKRITGGEKIVARQLHGRTISFPAAFDLILSMNNAPEFADRSEGLWRRIVVVPFEVRIPDEARIAQDEVQRRLNLEASGILRWMVEGYRDFREQGLNPPDKIRAESRVMRDRTDWLRAFVAETYDVDAGERDFVTFPELWAEFQSFARQDPTVKNPGRNRFYDEVRATYGEDKVGPKSKPGLRGWKKREAGSIPASPASPASAPTSRVPLTETRPEALVPLNRPQNRGNWGTGLTDALSGDGYGWLDADLPPRPTIACEGCGEPKVWREPARLMTTCENCDGRAQ